MAQDLITASLKAGITDGVSLYKNQSTEIDLAEYLNLKRITGETITYPYSGTPFVQDGGDLANRPILQIASGASHTLLLSTDGSMASFGTNAFGELGNGGTSPSGIPTMVVNDVVGLDSVTKIKCHSSYSSWALTQDKDLFGWGYIRNSVGIQQSNIPFLIESGVLDFAICEVNYGMLKVVRKSSGLFYKYNTGSFTSFSTASLGSLSGKTVTQIEGYGPYVVALCSDNTMYSVIESNLYWVQLPLNGALTGKTVTRLVGGYDRIFAFCSDGTIAGLGSNAYGKLGTGNTISQSSWTAVSKTGILSGKTITDLSVGTEHTLFICSDGTVAAVGNNTFGQLGNGNTFSSATAVKVYSDGYLKNKLPISVAAGSFHSVVLTSDGNVFTFGSDINNELGNGQTLANSSTPAPIIKEGFTKYTNHIRFTSTGLPPGLSFDGNLVETAKIIGSPTTTGATNSLIKIELSDFTLYNPTPSTGNVYQTEAVTYISFPFEVKDQPTGLQPEDSNIIPNEDVGEFLSLNGVDVFFDLQSRALSLTPPKAEATIANDSKVINSMEVDRLIVKAGETLWLNLRFVKGPTPFDPVATGLRFGVVGKLGGPLLMEGDTFTKVGTGSLAYYRMRVTAVENEFAAIIDDYYDEDAVEQIASANENQPSTSGDIEGLCELVLTTGSGETIADIKSDTLGVVLKRSIFA